MKFSRSVRLLPLMLAAQFALVQTPFGQYARYPAQNYYPTPPYVPVTQQFADYPVHARNIDSHWNYDHGSYTGYGRADILSGDHRGFDFLYSCGEPFKLNQLRGEFYKANGRDPINSLRSCSRR